MTHEEAIDALLEVVAGATVPEARRDAAEAHVSACPECWHIVRLLHGTTVGAGDPGRTTGLFGCDTVGEQLYLLPGLSAEDARARHPEVVEHVRWCSSCRDDLASLASIEPGTTRPSLGDAWIEVTDALRSRAKERVWELNTRLMVGLGRLGVVLRGIPERPDVAPYGLPIPATRGGSGRSSDVSIDTPGRRITVALGDSGLTVHLVVEPEGTDRLRLLVTFDGGRQPMAVSLRQTGTETTSLIAAQSTAAATPFVVGGLVPGDYVIEVAETEPPRRFRLQLHVSPKEGTQPT